jgi:xylitol oxidase
MNLLPQIEAKLALYGARPHWAKIFTMNTSQIVPLYPRIQDFRALSREFDPKGKFRNRYMSDHVDTA